jgi:uncharacterized protein (DUF2147 family)
MLRLLVLGILLLAARPAKAADLTGLWLTQDKNGVIRISNCGSALCAQIAGFMLDHPTDPTPVDYKGASQCHLTLISDAQQVDPNLWKGHILDPRNGNIYGVELRINAQGNLALRGYLGIPLLGQTQVWTRYPGGVPADCRLLAAPLVAKELPSLPER